MTSARYCCYMRGIFLLIRLRARITTFSYTAHARRAGRFHTIYAPLMPASRRLLVAAKKWIVSKMLSAPNGDFEALEAPLFALPLFRHTFLRFFADRYH